MRVGVYIPEVSTSGWRWEERELFYRSVLPRAAFVISSTHVGRGDIERYYQVPPERISVLPFPTPKFPDVDASAPLELPVASPYLLYPAQFWPHKNHVGLLHTLRILTETHGLDFSIAFTGTDKGNLGHVRAVAEQLGLAQRVGFLGFVERSVLADLYRNAFALAFASFFGPDNLPPLEAFALGCPVIAGDAPGAREQLGDAVLLVDLFDDEGFARAVRQLVDTPDLRSELIARGATRASWSAHDYVGGLCRLLDGFAAVRRCWSSTEPFVHL